MHGAPQQPQQGGGLLATSCLAVSIMGLLPERIQQKGVVGSLVSSLGGALKGSPGAPSQQLPPQQPAGVPRSPLLFQPPPAANMADAGMLSQLFGGGTPA
jgi:hypothetical protein